MTTPTKVHCFFEQSGTFKNEFRKLRHTGSSNHGRGGEGAMITENLSCTISTLQDQTLFQTGGYK